MKKRRTGRILLAAILVLGVVALVGSAATGRLPVFARTWGTIASSVAALSSSASLAAREPDAGPVDDAGTIVRRQTAPLSSAQLGAPLVHGTFVSACGAPDDMKVVVNATVKMGRAVAVTVKTQPANPAVASCVERAARELQWDVSPKAGRVTVTY
jgi:hypothetical protein